VSNHTALEPRTAREILRISYDSDIDYLAALVPGAVVDGLQEDEVEEPLGGLYLFHRCPGGPLIGFGVEDLSEWDVLANDDEDALWSDELRFAVPTLGLAGATIGEIALAAQATIRNSTPDVLFYDLAVYAGETDGPEEAEHYWRGCLEAGEMKAHYGLGYTLVELGRPHEAFGHLRVYTEITPRNSWAWLWRGRAAQDMGELAEAAACYRRAIEAEEAGSYETDAEERLAQLDGIG
jgi:tetratricopeptide (TPR) repeat protein